ncbi:MAG: vitamin K epoxide reductase family protein [Micropruina sp.]
MTARQNRSGEPSTETGAEPWGEGPSGLAGAGQRARAAHPLRRLRQSNPWIFGTMLFSALISLSASFVLSADAIVLAADPQAALACNINAVLSCGTVGASWQASLFGFPNAFLGLIAEPVVITIAVASLGGVRFPRWFMFAAQIVYTLGLIFAYWLFFQAYFVIGALCPWCLLVTLSTTLVFTSLTHVNIRDGNLYLPERLTRTARTLIAHDLDLLLVTLWLVGIVAMVVIKYVPLML